MAAIGDKSHPIFIDACGQAQVCDSIAGGGGSTVVGSIVPYCGTDTPDGFFPCDGREISRETYADLYAVIGNTFGDPTDPTKFKLPKIDDARYLQGNTTPGTQVAAGLPQHYHSVPNTYLEGPRSYGNIDAYCGVASSEKTGNVSTDHTSGSGYASYKDATIEITDSVVPKSVTVRYLICWKKTIANDAPYVVERKSGTDVSGDYWNYTKWSDGYCEQEGIAHATGATITFPVAFKDTKYIVNAATSSSKATTSMTLSEGCCDWMAKGYVA